MKTLILALIWFFASACTIQYALFPKDPPADAVDQTFYLSPIQPQITRSIDLWLFRYLHWEGLEEFSSLILCPSGVPDAGESKKCLQFYGGVKIDGTDAIIRQRTGDMRWGYVYKHGVDGDITQNEQAAARWTTVSGDRSVYNMGGQ